MSRVVHDLTLIKHDFDLGAQLCTLSYMGGGGGMPGKVEMTAQFLQFFKHWRCYRLNSPAESVTYRI